MTTVCGGTGACIIMSCEVCVSVFVCMRAHDVCVRVMYACMCTCVYPCVCL